MSRHKQQDLGQDAIGFGLWPFVWLAVAVIATFLLVLTGAAPGS